MYGAYRYSFSLIMILGSLKYDTRASLDTTGAVFMSLIVPYSSYKPTIKQLSLTGSQLIL